MSKTAYSYVRFSTPEQALGDSQRRQLQLARDYAREHGLELDEQLTFRDLGVSAFRGSNAATGALRQFRNAVENGEIAKGSHLLVESLDRLSRAQVTDALALFQSIIAAGVVIVTLQDNKVYSKATIDANPMDLIYSILVMTRANEESQVKSKRLRAVWEAKRAKLADGKVLTSRVPAWLHVKDGVVRIVDAKAKIIQRVFSLTLKGAAPHGIATTFNREHVPLVGRGQRWHPGYINSILDNTAVVGTMTPQRLEYDGSRRKRRALEPIENFFPAVIDKATFERVRAMRQQTHAPLRGRHAKAELRNLIGGLARCPICDNPMIRSAKGPKDKARLVCSKAKAGAGCVYHSVTYDDVENAIVERRKEIAKGMPGASEIAREIEAELARVTANIDAAEERMDALTDELSRRASRAIASKLEALETEHEALRQQRAELLKRKEAVDGAYLKARLVELQAALAQQPLDRAKANSRLRQLLSSIVVDYRSGQLDLYWNHGGESSVQFAFPEEPEKIAEEARQLRQRSSTVSGTKSSAAA